MEIFVSRQLVVIPDGDRRYTLAWCGECGKMHYAYALAADDGVPAGIEEEKISPLLEIIRNYNRLLESGNTFGTERLGLEISSVSETIFANYFRPQRRSIHAMDEKKRNERRRDTTDVMIGS